MLLKGQCHIYFLFLTFTFKIYLKVVSVGDILEVWNRTLCEKDSDGDGLTNGQELGDPDCIWTQGSTPTASTNLSHPGYKHIFRASSLFVVATPY